jgi:diguanylate cyclase (GGDEF)-like protein/PAS domain S-box-containing protein
MTDPANSPLRTAAEAQLAATPSETPVGPVAELLHELRVHQIELEMQNEALRQSQHALEASRDRYLDLYEFAPVGYLTLSAEGVIESINLTGVTLLGRERKALLRFGFSVCVAPEERERWMQHFLSVREQAAPSRVELTLLRGDGTVFQAKLDCVPQKEGAGGTTLRVTLSDISERKAAEAMVKESEEFKTAILDAMSAQIAVLDRDGMIVLVNEAWRRFARDNAATPVMPARNTQVGTNYLAICQGSVGASTAGAGEAADGILGVLDGRWPSFSLEYPCHSPTAQRWFVMSVTPLGDERRGVVIAHTDITERQLAEDELRIAAVAFSTQNGMMITDPKGVILRVNPAFTRLTGYSAAEVVGQTPAMFSSGRHGPLFFQRMWQAIKDEGRWQGEIWNRRKNGQIYAEMLNIAAIDTPDRGIAYYVANFSDITADKEAEAEIHRLAYYDALTSLPNRRLLQDRLGQAVAATVRSGQYGAIFFIDLDNFKALNDTRGHDIGDLLLVEVAQRMRSDVREGDTVARLGGDEFVVLLEDLGADRHEAVALAGQLGEKLHAVIGQPCLLKDDEYQCNLSIGVSLFHAGDTVEDLFKHADLALYQAKNAGRNLLRFFDPAMQAEMDQRSALETELRRALNKQQLRLFYQPQVDAGRRVIGVEALLRWQHPERGLVPPNDFIPLAEETGLILPIGLWVLETACAQLKIWENDERTRDLRIAVNVSARQFRQADFVEHINLVLATSGANPAGLKLELTESLVLEDVAGSIEKMQAIKRRGVNFAMDDFGTGYSSLAYLAQLPLDQLKIDQSFVCNLPGNRNDETIARAIITLGRGLAMDVIAEGVETEAQRYFLEMHGCHAYQGYLFSRPLPVEELTVFLLAAPSPPPLSREGREEQDKSPSPPPLSREGRGEQDKSPSPPPLSREGREEQDKSPSPLAGEGLGRGVMAPATTKDSS